MEYILRELKTELKRSASEYPIVTILGPRQSGKTTLAKRTFSKKTYVSLENLDQRSFAQKDPKAFLENFKEGAIIDEIQRVPELLSYLQSEVDENPEPGRFILTGSNQYLLQEKVTQSLAGRVSLLRLLPFSISELQTTSRNLELNTLMFSGFYPRIHSENLRPTKWLDNYIETYVDKDVRLIKNISNLSQFTLFIKMCAARVGQLLNLESLGNDCGISQNTVKSWLSILESSFVLKVLQPYHSNFNKRLIKSPKIYFYDTGMLCRLLSLNDSKTLETHSLKGGIFENFVLLEIEKYFLNRGMKSPLYFWRDKSGHEIDILIESDPIKLIEVKAGKTFNSDYIKNIKYWQKIAQQKNEPYVIYSGDTQETRPEAILLPWENIATLFN